MIKKIFRNTFFVNFYTIHLMNILVLLPIVFFVLSIFDYTFFKGKRQYVCQNLYDLAKVFLTSG